MILGKETIFMYITMGPLKLKSASHHVSVLYLISNYDVVHFSGRPNITCIFIIKLTISLVNNCSAILEVF